VYRSFKDINEFMVELEELLKERKEISAARVSASRQKRS
jgi:transcriptional regulator NrdR family protein